MGIHANNRDLRLSRIYCDGVIAQKGGGAIESNPWDAGTNTQEADAWATGFNDALGAAVDLSMCGYPGAGLPSPELTENRY